MSGRRDELAALDASLAQVRQDGLAAVLVSGESGIGKSTLVRHFLRTRCNDRRGRVVLRGRCYERESVPYKAIDSLIDDLSRYWRSLPGRDANELLPRNAELLTRLFPVLGRVPAVAGAPRARTVADAQQLKNRAFEALRELLQRIAERNQLVLVLDDMQWVDGNTMELFADLTRPPDPPQVLLILVSRPEGLPALRAFLERMGSALHEIELSPLAPHHARALAASLMDREAADPLVSRIVDETGGHPFFITELAHYLQTVDHASTESVSLDQVIERRVQTLSKVGRRALELIALTGQPVPQSVVARAADLEPGAFMQELGLLRTLHFVRTGGAGGEAWVETYHDRVRETVRETLGADARAAGYRRLALAFEEWGRESSELLVRLWRGAEAHDRAAEHARIAGDAAIATFDFERAAAHYELTLELGNHKPADERELRIAIAEAYASAGRALDASRAFDTATTGADPAQRLELRRRSAEQLLRGGYMEEGLALTDDVLRSIGLRAVGKVGAVARLLAYRMWLRVRGLRFRRRPPSELSQRTLTELDTLWSVSAGLSMVDLLQSTYFQCRHAVAALKLGEPSRIVRALALEAIFLARQGNGRRAVRFATRATEVADELDDPYGTALAVAAQGIIDFFVRNHWAAGVERFERAEEIMRDNYRYGGWEVDTLRLFATFCRMHLGRLRELERLVPTYVREAERLGDRFAVVNLRTRMAIVRLLRDQPDIAEKDAQDAIASWSATERGYQVQSWFALFGLVEVALYRGDAARAAEIIEQHSRPLRRSLLLVVPVVRAEWLHLQGRVLLARAAASGDARYLRATDSLARRLERGKIPLARALAAMLRAGVARLSGDRERARQTLAEALERLEAGDTQLYAPVVRRRLAAMLGGDEGAELQAAADAWFADNRVANPERWCELLLPGFAEA